MNTPTQSPRRLKGNQPAVWRLQVITYLANAIDVKCEKLESALTLARKEQLQGQLTMLSTAFEQEYASFLEETQSPAGSA